MDDDTNEIAGLHDIWNVLCDNKML